MLVTHPARDSLFALFILLCSCRLIQMNLHILHKFHAEKSQVRYGLVGVPSEWD